MGKETFARCLGDIVTSDLREFTGGATLRRVEDADEWTGICAFRWLESRRPGHGEFAFDVRGMSCASVDPKLSDLKTSGSAAGACA